MILQFFPTVCRAIRDIDFYLTQRKGSYRPQGIGLGCLFVLFKEKFDRGMADNMSKRQIPRLFLKPL